MFFNLIFPVYLSCNKSITHCKFGPYLVIDSFGCILLKLLYLPHQSFATPNESTAKITNSKNKAYFMIQNKIF